MDLLLKEIVLLLAFLFGIFILTSEGKYMQHNRAPVKSMGKIIEGVKSTDKLFHESFPDQNDDGLHSHIAKRSTGTSIVYTFIYTEKSAPGTVISAYVDSTMSKLIFEAAVKRSNPVMLITTPSGTNYTQKPSINGSANAGDVVARMEINLTSTDIGIWKITKLDANIWDVKIMGESPVDFTFELIDVSTGIVIKEDPIQGKTYKLNISVTNYAQMKTIGFGMMFEKEHSAPKGLAPLKDYSGGKYEYTYTMLNQSVIFGIQGYDNSRKAFRRVSPRKMTPVTLKLIVPPYAGVKLYENKTLGIDFTVVNIWTKEQDIDVRIDDDKGFGQSPQILSVTLKPGENFTDHFTLKAGMVIGETTTAVITARPHLGPGQLGLGPSETRLFTVESNRTTTTSTTTTTTTATTSTSSTALPTSHSTVNTKAAATSTTFARNSLGSQSLGLSTAISPVSAGSSTAGSSNIATASAVAGSSVSPSTPGSASGQILVSSQSAPPSPSVTTFVVAGGSVNNVQPLASGSPSGTAKPAAVVPGTVATGPGKTANDGTSNADSEFNKSEVLAAAIVSGIAGGVLVGIGGLVVMGLVFRGAMKRVYPNSVKPEHETDRVRNQNFRRKHVHDHDLSWT